MCALTDDGLIMKSFLCPESTLFDQTILKCNWWFYVDCKSSKTLYDSNLPVSKSYQLMKALTFFSNFKKNKASNDTEPALDVEALQNSVLTKRNARKLPAAKPVVVVQSSPVIAARLVMDSKDTRAESTTRPSSAVVLEQKAVADSNPVNGTQTMTDALLGPQSKTISDLEQ